MDRQHTQDLPTAGVALDAIGRALAPNRPARPPYIVWVCLSPPNTPAR